MIWMNAFLRRISMLCLMRMAADMVLPDGTMRRICDVIMGLMVMLCMLEALLALLTGLKI